MSATKEAREELARVLGDTRADEILAKLESSAQALKEAGVRWKEQAAQSQAAEPVVSDAEPRSSGQHSSMALTSSGLQQASSTGACAVAGWLVVDVAGADTAVVLSGIGRLPRVRTWTRPVPESMTLPMMVARSMPALCS